MRKLLVTFTIAGLAVAFGAAPGVAGGGSAEKFCKAWLVVKAAEGGPSERQQQRALDAAPSDLADAVETAFTQFEELGEGVFADSTFIDALSEVDAFVVDECGYENFDVTLQDYAFIGVPDEVEKGKVAFTLTNEGAELHEFSVYKLKGDYTLEDVVSAPDEEAALELMTPVKGGGFAFPGGSETAFFNLKKTGDYVALCVIPVGTTPESIQSGGEGGTGPPHLVEGMAAEFEVTS